MKCSALQSSWFHTSCMVMCAVLVMSSLVMAQTQRRSTNSTSIGDPADPPMGQLPKGQIPSRRSVASKEPRTYAPTPKGIRVGAFVQAKFTDNLSTTPTDIQTSFMLTGIPDIGISFIMPLEKEYNTWSIGCDLGYTGYGITHDRINILLGGITMPRLIGSRTYQAMMLVPKIFYHAVYAGIGIGLPLGGNATRTVPGQVVDIPAFRALGDTETFRIQPSAMPVIFEARFGAAATIYRDESQEVLIGAMVSLQLNTMPQDHIGSLSTFAPRMIGAGIRLSYGFTIGQ